MLFWFCNSSALLSFHANTSMWMSEWMKKTSKNSRDKIGEKLCSRSIYKWLSYMILQTVIDCMDYYNHFLEDAEVQQS